MDLREILSANLQYYRVLKKLSQEALAEKIGKSRYAIAMYETMKNYPRLETLSDIADALGIEAYLLLKDRSYPRERNLDRLATAAREIQQYIQENQ